MALPRFSLIAKVVFVCLLSLIAARPALAQHGVVFSGEGAVNRSMGGAATAAPLDATGALYWNPATITGLERSELEVGVEGLYAQTRLSSSIAPGTLAPGFPPQTISGSSSGENGMFAMPSFGLVYLPENSDWALGMGMFVGGGFGVNYPGSTTNPILTAPPPAGVGLGPVYTQFQVLQLVPTLAYKINDHLSVGVGPTLDMAELQVAPGIITAPDDANGNGVATYPALTHQRYQFGGGVQAGIYYTTDNGWGLGASVKSPQWFESFRWFTTDELGRPQVAHFRLDYPLIVSTGVSYSGFERWLLAADFRFIDYSDTAGFRNGSFAPNGAVQGVGWHSIFGMALGAQYKLTDQLSVRAGYSFNEDPIPNALASINIGSSVVQEHAVYCGFSYRVSDALILSLAYLHVFGNSIEGPILTPAGAIPGSQVRDEVTAADCLVLGLTVQFGGCGSRNAP